MSNFLLFCKRLKIYIKSKYFYCKYYLVKILCTFIPYLKNMRVDREKLVIDLTKMVNNHFENFNQKHFFKINDALFPPIASSDTNNVHNDYNKFKTVVDYKIENVNTSYFHVFIHCYGNVIENIKANFNEMDIDLSFSDHKILMNFHEHFSKLEGETIK